MEGGAPRTLPARWGTAGLGDVMRSSVWILIWLMVLGLGPLRTDAAAEDVPYTFFFTRYEVVGPMDQPERVVYHSGGPPFAKATDGSTVTITGQGGWEPNGGQAEGGGQ